MSIAYTIRKSRRARYARISVRCDGSVVVTQPQAVPLAAIESFVQEKADWITHAIALFIRHRIPRQSPPGEFAALKGASFALVKARIAVLNTFYGFPFRRISIRNQKTRWGSSSKTGTLSFNYRIAKLPPDLADYLIVHELCHLKEMNHSEKFWALVAQTIPCYRELRSLLKKESLF